MYTVHMEIEGVNCSVAELVNRPVSISWASHFPELRRASRVFGNLSRFSGLRCGRQMLVSIIRLGLRQRISRQGQCACPTPASAWLLASGTPSIVKCGCPRYRGEVLRPAACACKTDALIRRKDDPWHPLAMWSRFLSALVHKYGDVFSGRTEYRPPFDALRLRTKPVEVTGPLRLGSAQASILRDGATTPRLLRPNGFVRVFMKCFAKLFSSKGWTGLV